VFGELRRTVNDGDPCYGAGGYGSWWITIRNQGTGAGNVRLYERKGTHLVAYRDLQLRRALFPRETVTFSYSDAELVLDPDRKNRILEVPPQYSYRCG